jgi:hypothetical protein
VRSDRVPSPTKMPVDSKRWFEQLNLSNFVNAYYQYNDLRGVPDCQHVLVVGPGQGLAPEFLKWRGYDVRTFDIDSAFGPEHLGSVHDMAIFADRQFDAVIVSHVLEHLPVAYLDKSLREIARVGRFALLYLPVAGRHFQIRFLPGLKGVDISLIFDMFNYFHKPDGITARYCQRQHFWEVGMRGFRLRDIKARLSPYFDICASYRNRDWNPSQNFLLKSKTQI